MTTTTKHLNNIIGLWLLLLVTACSSSSDPHKQLVSGPFDIDTQWKKVILDRPFETGPHYQTFEIHINIDQYEMVDLAKKDPNYGFSASRFKRLSDGAIFEPEVILIDSLGRQFKAFYKSIGSAFIKEGDFKSMDFGINPRSGKFNYPKDTKFVAFMIRANIPTKVSSVRWIALHYFQAPNRKWDQVIPSEIIDMDALDYRKKSNQ